MFGRSCPWPPWTRVCKSVCAHLLGVRAWERVALLSHSRGCCLIMLPCQPESQLPVSTIPSTPESQQGPPILIWGRPGKASGGLVWESSGPAHWPSLTGRCHTVCSDREPGGMSRPHGNPSLPGYAGLGPGAPGRGRGPRKWHPHVLGTALGSGSLPHLGAWEPSPPGFLPWCPVAWWGQDQEGRVWSRAAGSAGVCSGL